MSWRAYHALGIGLFFDLLILDQLTKWYFTWASEITLIPDWVRLTYVENPGIAFSLPLEGILLQVVTLVALLVCGVVMYRYRVWEDMFLFFFCLFLLAGGIGNALDRFFRGFVVDFISIGAFPVFNMADIYVNIGVFGLLFSLLILRRGEHPA